MGLYVVCRVIADHTIMLRGIVQGRISPTSHTTNTVYEIAAKVVLTSAFVGGVVMKSQSPGFACHHDRLQHSPSLDPAL